MPYKDLGGSLTYEGSQRGWQVRIAINPSVLREDDPNNKIKEITEILNRILADYPTNAKIWLIPNKQALYDGEYDGTTSRQGKDREQRGKEVCIYLADTECALSAHDYKIMLLALWSELEKAGIPLMYMNVPGDRKILGPSNLPTPFSITSFTQRKEWLDKHGILFKQFVPWDTRHPILKIKISEKDLKTQKIPFDAIRIAKLNRDYFDKHQNKSINRLKNDIDAIAKSDISYKKALSNEELTLHIKAKIKNYNETMKILEIDQRGKFQEEFINVLQQDQVLQYIYNGYPHKPDSSFSEHEAIGILKRLSQVQEDQVDELLKQLRDDYQQEINDIKSDYEKHANGNNKTPETMHIDWSNYIPSYNDELCQSLIEKNPAQMQVIYRRIILLEREKQAHEEFKKQWLKAYYGNNKPYEQLAKFSKEIKSMEKNIANGSDINPNVLTKFKSLYAKLEEEIFSHAKCNFNKTVYPVVLDHFTTMAHEINSGKKYTVDEMTTSCTKLDKKLLNKKPMSPLMKAGICGVIGAVVGAIVGLVFGAAVTFWGGGFGSLPAAIAGGMIGYTVAEGLVIGGASLTSAITTAAISATGGFFSGKDNHAKYAQKQNDKQALQTEIDDTYQSLGLQSK